MGIGLGVGLGDGLGDDLGDGLGDGLGGCPGLGRAGLAIRNVVGSFWLCQGFLMQFLCIFQNIFPTTWQWLGSRFQ